MQAMFDLINISASIEVADNATTGHGRALEIDWSSGTRLTVRFDQGVGYSRGEGALGQESNYFEPGANDIELQARNSSNFQLRVTGNDLPTQIFIKLREVMSA